MLNIEDLKAAMGKTRESSSSDVAADFELDDDGEEYMPVGINGVLAASEKLLAINRGLTEEDERDSFQFQKVFRVNSMLSEGIKMDAGKAAKNAMYRAAKFKNLQGFDSGAFNSYVDRIMVGNPLTTPLEEINPMHLVENARRISRMGPGGLRSSESITEAAQSVHPSQFGFISTIEGPECFAALPEGKVYTKKGWIPVEDITMDSELACRIDGKLEFHKPEHVTHEYYSGTVYGSRHLNISFLVTPNHRFYTKYVGNENTSFTFRYAKDIYGKTMLIPCTHEAYEGDTSIKTFSPDGEHVYNVEDWAALLGWFLSEGSLDWGGYTDIPKSIMISQVEDIHPDEFAEIKDLASRMNLWHYPIKADRHRFKQHGYTKNVAISIRDAHIRVWFSQYNKKSYHKWIPEEVFEWPIYARKALLDTLLKGDGRVNKTHTTYCSVSKKLAEDVERLAIGLGYCTRIREEKDKRAHVKTTNYAVCLLKSESRHLETNDKRYKPYWYKKEYAGMVHCATVPGGLLYYSAEGRPGAWYGNSERAGIDVRAAWGTKLGSNGRVYQKFYDRREKRMKWLSAQDTATLTVRIPD